MTRLNPLAMPLQSLVSIIVVAGVVYLMMRFAHHGHGADGEDRRIGK